jgi:hypothetical protein
VTDEQCPSQLEDTRCQLRVDHKSAHAARDGGALVSWANPEAGDHAKEIVLDWYGE